jgi:lysine 2,3-aminomutase
MNLYQNTPLPQEWTHWKWQLQNRARNLKDLEKYFYLSPEEIAIFPQADEFFDFAVTPYYLSLADDQDPNCPIRKQIIPSAQELVRSPYEVADPLAEEAHMPVKGVTHRYPDRALWYLSHVCAVYCRFCTRKRKVGNSQDTPRTEDWDKALAYFQAHQEIKEVILSGGDPLSLSDNQLDYLLTELKSIPHINQVRIHTRYPVTLPFRITKELCSIFKKHYPLFLVTHFNHAKEISPEAQESIRILHQEGNVIVLNQSVLLKGINDTIEDLKNLFYGLTKIGVKPYYLHQCDEVFGSSGFRVNIEKGKALMKEIRGHISGVSVPVYVADLTGGGGKVPLPTDYLEKQEFDGYTFVNFQNKTYKIGL